MDCTDLLRIDDATYRRITAEMRARSACGPQTGKRIAERFDLAVDKPFILVLHPLKRSEREAFLVRPFDVSSSGMGLLHGRMEYANTSVAVLARDLNGQVHKIDGRIAQCRLVSGRIHAVGVQLAQTINPLDFASQIDATERARQQAAWQTGWTDLLKLSNSDVEDILYEIESNDDPKRRAKRKDITRIDFREGAVLVIVHPDDPNRRHRYRVIPTNLSATGIGFLHGAFLHPGTVCDVMLMTLGGQTEIIRGTIARCELAQGKVHRAGVKFEKRIRISRFVAANDQAHSGAA